MIKRKIVVLIAFLFLITSFTVSIQGITISENSSNFSEVIDVDIQVKKPGSDWEESSLTADIDTVLDFKINVQTHRSYEGVGIYVELPSVGSINMFEYVEDSSSPKPVLPFGVWEGDDTNVMWFWFLTGPSWSKEASFSAYIREEGTKSVEVRVTGVISFDPDDPLFDEATDSLQITGEDDGPCCFPAGTLITLADGSKKKIENIQVGDWILGWNYYTNRHTIWRVHMLGDPVHKVISINNGLIEATVDHAFYVKKPDGRIGWGVYDLKRGEKSNIISGELLTLREKDKIFTSENSWVEVTNISISSEHVQTYNILSFTGRRSYYANGLLVHEEYPKELLLSSKINVFFEKIFLFLQPIFYEFLNKISTLIY